MNSREFARKWLEKQGLFDKDSDYEGWLGECVMTVVHVIATQGHSSGSAFLLVNALEQLYKAYDNPDDPVWKEYWESDEGKAVIDQVNGKE